MIVIVAPILSVVKSTLKRELVANVDVLGSEIKLVMVVVIISSELVEITDRIVVVVSKKTLVVDNSVCVLTFVNE